MSKKATKDSWKTKKLSNEKKEELNLKRKFSKSEFKVISRGYIPEEMEDKWFIYMEDNIIYFHRSWTGICIYQVRLKEIDEHYEIDKCWMNNCLKQNQETKNKNFKVITLIFLIEKILLNNNIKHPHPWDDDEVEKFLDKVKERYEIY